jgi:hypothetical protein
MLVGKVKHGSKTSVQAYEPTTRKRRFGFYSSSRRPERLGLADSFPERSAGSSAHVSAHSTISAPAAFAHSRHENATTVVPSANVYSAS